MGVGCKKVGGVLFNERLCSHCGDHAGFTYGRKGEMKEGRGEITGVMLARRL